MIAEIKLERFSFPLDEIRGDNGDASSFQVLSWSSFDFEVLSLNIKVVELNLEFLKWVNFVSTKVMEVVCSG